MKLTHYALTTPLFVAALFPTPSYSPEPLQTAFNWLATVGSGFGPGQLQRLQTAFNWLATAPYFGAYQQQSA